MWKAPLGTQENVHNNIITYSHLPVASSPGSPIFSTHTRKEGEPGIQCHVRDVAPYTKVGRVADCENCAWAGSIYPHHPVHVFAHTIQAGLSTLCVEKIGEPGNEANLPEYYAYGNTYSYCALSQQSRLLNLQYCMLKDWGWVWDWDRWVWWSYLHLKITLTPSYSKVCSCRASKL